MAPPSPIESALAVASDGVTFCVSPTAAPAAARIATSSEPRPTGAGVGGGVGRVPFRRPPEGGAGRREDRHEQRAEADGDEPAEEGGAPVDPAVLLALERAGGVHVLARADRGAGPGRGRRVA